MSAYTIYHNPQCSNSRKALALLREHGIEPTVIEYLKTPPSRAEIADLTARAGITPRALLRAKDAPELDDPAVGDDAILDAMAARPALINRPLVVSPRGVKLCRPGDLVLDLIG